MWPRLAPVNSALHIMCRGNNKQEILQIGRDKLQYYSLLEKYREENKISIFHYCIMDNHVHLIVWLTESSTISKFMKQVNLSYSVYYNNIYNYCGHLWQGRFKSKIIADDPYLLQCGKYIELNPVRKGLVRSPEEYLFSSYNHYANNKSDPLITDSPVYLSMSESKQARNRAYRKFIVRENMENASPPAEAFSGGRNVLPGEKRSPLWAGK